MCGLLMHHAELWYQLRLGTINGPNEGLAIVASLNILTAIVGPEFWKLDVFNIGIPW
jgi:hypothetical protein